MAGVRAILIVGYGLNCEAETRYALSLAGADVDLVHLGDLIAGRKSLDSYRLLVLIGGFAFGDHLSAGKVLANRLKFRLRDQLKAFIEREKLIIGICNGFQTITKVGLLPGFDGDYGTQHVTLTTNDSGVFRNAWIRLRAEERSRCVFTRGIDFLEVPIRHGEGKFCVRDRSVLDRLISEEQVAFRYADPETGEPTMAYPHNPNGSVHAIAGICDPTGRIFGMMPHPEAFTSPYNHPHWLRQKMEGKLSEEGAGLKIFRNAVEYLK